MNSTTEAPENGFVVCSDGNIVRSTCYFGCEEGYLIAGNQQITCGDDEIWDAPPPSCTSEYTILSIFSRPRKFYKLQLVAFGISLGK